MSAQEIWTHVLQIMSSALAKWLASRMRSLSLVRLLNNIEYLLVTQEETEREMYCKGAHASYQTKSKGFGYNKQKERLSLS